MVQYTIKYINVKERMDNMIQFLKNVKKDMILVTVFQLLAGILLLIFSDSVVRLISYVCAAVLLIYGVMHAMTYFKQETVASGQYDLVKGIIGIAAGVILLVKPGILSGILFTILAIIIILDSVAKFQDALDLKKLNYQNWWIMMLLAVIMAVMGLIVLFNPFRTASMLVSFVGVVLILNAAVDLWDIFYISKKVDNFLDK